MVGGKPSCMWPTKIIVSQLKPLTFLSDLWSPIPYVFFTTITWQKVVPASFKERVKSPKKCLFQQNHYRYIFQSINNCSMHGEPLLKTCML